MREWKELPPRMKNSEVRRYYDILYKKKYQLFIKRIFDIYASALLIVILLPVFFVISVIIKSDSKGPVFYRQVRVTVYGKKFKIFKFRTMVNRPDRAGSQITVKDDSRITKAGRFLRKCRLDELPQLLNIFLGDMTFVGTRPEVPKYVKHYNEKMMATLLLPAGVTSRTSILYKDEDELLQNADDIDKIYIEKIMPAKMEYNLKELDRFSLFRELGTMFLTLAAVLR